MPQSRMLINYVPGDECRVAILEDGKLEEYHAERFDSINRVGNIYLGRVANVEPGIQAAFVDFGVEENGFLHVSDLHPMYFPGEDDETTERVGRKTPRRDRPPIQKALKRGQEILVQVLKDGVGTKGPALTSYLSIPGRFLVMMPNMDRVGVSRKVEDEDQRRKMRQILDQLDLPDGFGFILRTAGFERNKTELKRDLAFLQRLWKDMDRKQKGGKAPKLLYTESDLLVRALRDQLTGDVDEVVIDSEVALRRAGQLMRLISPRGRTKIMKYTGSTPSFHAFGVEQQIAAMHAREVPMPAGGRLVIDETEALIAIDVNSGKTRGVRDPETMAYRTNLEAADEICRQLRLRDQGGLVICDLIDMRDAKHRKDVENRFRDRLKRDRARSTILPISGFGILEMTRQRMKGSHESVHFSECPTCVGRGLVQKAESVAADALRELAALVGQDRVARVEMVVSPRVAGALLSTRRTSLSRVERASGKHVDVRVSESVPLDRVRFYAYEENGNDIEIDSLPKTKTPESSLEEWDVGDAGDWAVDVHEEAAKLAATDVVLDEEPADELEAFGELGGDEDDGAGAVKKKSRRRRRRRGKKKDEDAPAVEGDSADVKEQPAEPAGPADGPADEPSDGPEAMPAKKKSRRRRKKASSDRRSDESAAEPEPESEPEPKDDSTEGLEGGGKKKRRRRRRKKSSEATEATDGEAPSVEPRPDTAEQSAGDADASDQPKKKRRRRRGRGGGSGGSSSSGDKPVGPKPSEPAPTPQVRPRTLYGAGRRRLSASDRTKTDADRD